MVEQLSLTYNSSTNQFRLIVEKGKPTQLKQEYQLNDYLIFQFWNWILNA